MGKSGTVTDIKLIAIGNSKGIRLSKTLLHKYGFSDTLVLEETDRGILIRKKETDHKLSWDETFQEMAVEGEDWGDFDVSLTDGLEDE